MIAKDFIGYSGMQLHPELNRRYFERVAGVNREKLGAFKPGQYQPSEEDFKPNFKEKMTFFLKESDGNCLIPLLSIATQLSRNLMLSCIQFLFVDISENKSVHLLNKIGKNQDKSMKETSVIDFCRLIDTIDINRIRFTDFYRFID